MLVHEFLVVVDDGSTVLVTKALIVASKRAKEHKKRSPKAKDMAKTVALKCCLCLSQVLAVVPLLVAVVPLER